MQHYMKRIISYSLFRCFDKNTTIEITNKKARHNVVWVCHGQYIQSPECITSFSLPFSDSYFKILQNHDFVMYIEIC